MFKAEKDINSMAEKISKIKTKRLPKGQRTHVRRLKQAARKEAVAAVVRK